MARAVLPNGERDAGKQMNTIVYREGYEYQLVEDAVFQLDFAPPAPIDNDLIAFDANGVLTCRRWFAFDGGTGAIDTKAAMPGFCAHDALYYLLRQGLLPPEYRKRCDKAMIRIHKANGVWFPRLRILYRGVRLFAGFAADPANETPILRAP